MMHFGLMALVTVVMHMVSAQDRNNILQQGGSQNARSEIGTSRSRAFLSCENGDMVVTVNFTQPFRGLIYAHRSRNSPCRVQGYGESYYVLRIPLKGCGTWQESPRVFVNNITIRFHPALELEEDETKTIVCRYPPPLTPSPGGIYIIEPSTPSPSGASRIQAAKLSEVEILIIICLLLFLSLLTLGIGIAYFCLKRRNIHLVRRKPLSSGPASQLTKLSGSTPLQPSQLSGTILGHTVKIPRVVPYSASLRTQTFQDSPNSPGISRDSLESTPSTSTTSGDSAEGTELLSNSLLGTSRNLTIPKAVLKKRDFNRRTLPHVHQRSSPVALSSTKAKQSGEFEDQTVTTVLEPEYSDYGNQIFSTGKKGPSADPTTFPVYAQVEKKKQRVRIAENAQIMHSDDSDQQLTNETGQKITKQTPTFPGRSQKQGSFIAKTTADHGGLHTFKPSSSRFNKSISQHSKDTTLLQQNRGFDEPDKSKLTDKSMYSKLQPYSTRSSVIPEERTLCIKDISDVYVTTTVETESTETKTTVSRDIIEKHVKDTKGFAKSNDNLNLESSSAKTKKLEKSNLVSKDLTQTENKFDKLKDDSLGQQDTSYTKHDTDLQENESSPPSMTANWNVVIRQRKSPVQNTSEFGSPAGDESVDSLPELPQFNVKIRALPVFEKKTMSDSSADILNVPQLQMPHSIEKIKDIISHLESSRAKESDEIFSSEFSKNKMGSQPSKTVRWPDNINPIVKTYSPEPVSSSESSPSETNLRERSSSEVLEKAPVLLSPKKHATSTLERSTSEIVSKPENYSRWNKDVPVFQSFPPEFLGNIPVVTQGGFFNDPSNASENSKVDKKTNSSTETWYI